MVEIVEPCEHGKCEFDDFPTFDVEAAKGLTSSEIRKRWPRKLLKCKKCYIETICYASYEHYIYGDW